MVYPGLEDSSPILPQEGCFPESGSAEYRWRLTVGTNCTLPQNWDERGGSWAMRHPAFEALSNSGAECKEGKLDMQKEERWRQFLRSYKPAWSQLLETVTNST